MTGYLRTCVEETAEQFALDCDLACAFRAYKLVGNSGGSFTDTRLIQSGTELGLDITFIISRAVMTSSSLSLPRN